MGIKFRCPNGHKLNVKSFLAGKRGICPHCGVGVDIPGESQAASGKSAMGAKNGSAASNAAPVGAAVARAAMPAPAAAPMAAMPAQKAQPVAAAVAPMPQPAYAVPQPAALAAAVSPAAPSQAQRAAAPVGAPAATALANPFATPAAPAGVLPDPIAEAPSAVWYVRPPSGGQFGPAKGDIMRKWIAEGRVSADSLVWREGWPDWKTAGPLFPALARINPPAASAVSGSASGPSVAVAMPANPLSQPLPSASTARIRKPAPKNSNALALAMVVLLGLISVILIVVFIYVVASGKLNSGRKSNETSYLYSQPDFDVGPRGPVVRTAGSAFGRG